jgi:predicted glycoside hydrolase/deacetylase ChbG (UPF0249 family)
VAKNLIVNADDFNLTAGVSRGILDAHRQGIVTSTSAMVNLPGLRRQRELAVDAADLSVGLHLNLTLGPPVIPAEYVPSLVNAHGEFVRDGGRQAAAGESGELRGEIAAQADRFHALFDRRPTHIDTHHHVHRHPPILEAVLDLGCALGIPVRSLSPMMTTEIRRRCVPCPDRLVGDVSEEAYWTADRLLALIPTIPDGVTELMCHPGQADEALAASSYCAQREGERAALCDPLVREALQASEVRLVSYAKLGVLPWGPS